MKKEEVTKFIEDKGDTSYVIRTEDDDKKFLDNYGKSVLEKELDPAIAKIHNQYDADLKELFGSSKKPGEKTYNFLKSQFNSLKEKAERVDVLESEVESLKKGSPEVETKIREIKALNGQIEKMKQDYESKITEVTKNNLKNSIKSEIQRVVGGLKIKSGIPESMKQTYIESTINDLSLKAEVRDGQIVFLEADGTAMRDKATMLPITVEALVKERMKDAIETERIVKGPGIVEKIEKVNGKINISVPSDITSREKLGEYLVKELGIKRNTKEYTEAYAEFGKDMRAFENSK
jgi:hypothetical protein